MRIISGKWKGRPLVSFKADHIRPTTDRVKEVIFNMLQFEIQGAQVLDLFSGTGSLAFEALSRGAKRVVAVESSRKSKMIIEKNVKLLKVGNELEIHQVDVFKFIKSSPLDFDIILIDPPFTKKIAHDVMEELAKGAALRRDCVVFIESSKQEKILDSYPPFELKIRKNFGDKSLSQFVVSELANGPE